MERMHLDALPVEGIHIVKMDSTLLLNLEKPVAGSDDLFGNDSALIDQIYSDLHRTNKRFIAGFMTDEMAARIQLNA